MLTCVLESGFEASESSAQVVQGFFNFLSPASDIS